MVRRKAAAPSGRCLTVPVDFPPMPLRLDTRRLLLTPESAEDAGWFAELLTARGGRVFSIEEARERIAVMETTIAALGIGALVLRTRSDGAALGYCALIVGRASLAEPELAYELLPAAHGQGYATEAAGAMVEAGFATGRSRLWSTVRAWNAPSLRVLDKLGFHRHHITTDDDGGLLWLRRDR